MSDRTTEVAVASWEVIEYHGTHLVMAGYTADGEMVVRRHYELQPDETDVKAGGRWSKQAGTDDGGFPLDARFHAVADDAEAAQR